MLKVSLYDGPHQIPIFEKMMKKIGRQGGGGLLKNLFGGGMNENISQNNPEDLLNSPQNPFNFGTKSRLPLNIPFRKK